MRFINARIKKYKLLLKINKLKNIALVLLVVGSHARRQFISSVILNLIKLTNVKICIVIVRFKCSFDLLIKIFLQYIHSIIIQYKN